MTDRSEQMKRFWQEVKAGTRPAPKRGQGNGTIKRKVRCASNWCKTGELVLTIYPHGEFGFREPHRRAEYRLGMTEAYRQAVLITTGKIAARAKELKRAGVRNALKQARRELL